jgi:hypothetical protein
VGCGTNAAPHVHNPALGAWSSAPGVEHRVMNSGRAAVQVGSRACSGLVDETGPVPLMAGRVSSARRDVRDTAKAACEADAEDMLGAPVSLLSDAVLGNANVSLDLVHATAL